MKYKEAIEWLRGNRSMTNMIPSDPQETWLVRIAQADAAMTQQAYWVVKAEQEGLTLVAFANALPTHQMEYLSILGGQIDESIDEIDKVVWPPGHPTWSAEGQPSDE